MARYEPVRRHPLPHGLGFILPGGHQYARTKSPIVRTTPMTMTKTRSSVTLMRARRYAPTCPPMIEPTASTAASTQSTSRENAKTSDGREIHHARQQIFRGAGGTEFPSGRRQRGQHQNADAAAEIAAIDGDRELRSHQRAAAQMHRRFRVARPKTAPGKNRRRDQHEKRHDALEEMAGRQQQQTRARHAADKADHHEFANGQLRVAGNLRTPRQRRRDLPGKQRDGRRDVRRARIQSRHQQDRKRDERSSASQRVLNACPQRNDEQQ